MQDSGAAQATAVPGRHVPPTHRSVPLQRMPSLQFASTVHPHAPDGSTHALDPAQSIGVASPHIPAAQVSAPLQVTPSPQSAALVQLPQ